MATSIPQLVDGDYVRSFCRRFGCCQASADGYSWAPMNNAESLALSRPKLSSMPRTWLIQAGGIHDPIWRNRHGGRSDGCHRFGVTRANADSEECGKGAVRGTGV